MKNLSNPQSLSSYMQRFDNTSRRSSQRRLTPEAFTNEDLQYDERSPNQSVISSVSSETENRKDFRTNLRQYFTDYTEHTGIHGAKYLGEQNRTIFEKLCWAIALIIAIYFCVTLILKAYHKWITTPVIVNFATKETPIWQIPFPAITICPETKTSPKIFNYTDFLIKKRNHEILDKKENLHFSYISFLCKYRPELKFNLDDFINPDDLFAFFEKAAPSFINGIFDCGYMGESYRCDEIFTPIITDEGLCYSFNILNRSEVFNDVVVLYKNHYRVPKTSAWTLDEGYRTSAGKDTYPLRALLAGLSFKFEVKMRTMDDDIDVTCGSIHGFRVRIHQPAQYPRLKQQHIFVPLNQAVLAKISPKIVTTSESVEAYDPEIRYCFFSRERSLKFFKAYSQENCITECLSNYTLFMCGCVDFYMPRNKTTKICGAPLRECIDKAQDDIVEEVINLKIRSMRGLEPENKETVRIMRRCNCKPECTQISYVVENSQAQWDWIKKYKAEGKCENYNNTHMSYLQVFFKSNQFFTSERNELYGPTDFLANSGGLLGLFMGFSVLSSFEILYFLTLRLVCNVKLFGARFWAGKKE